MFSTITIALLLSIGGAAWVYSQIQRRTGGNSQTSMTMAGIAAVALFLFVLIVASFIPN